MTRYAIRFPDGSYYCQGSPKDNTFTFAILYASVDYAKKAMKKHEAWFSRSNAVIVPVTCTIGEPI